MSPEEKDQVPVTLGRIDEKISQIVRVVPDHERRLRRLEWIVAGAVASVGMILQNIYMR